MRISIVSSGFLDGNRDEKGKRIELNKMLYKFL